MRNQVLTIFTTLFIVIDPLGIVPIFLALAGHLSPARRRSIILKAAGIAFLVLCLFIFLGNGILRFLGIQAGSFSIAGGILLFIASIDMLLGAPRRTKVSPQEMEDPDIAVFPLAIPLLAGPGAITSILLFVSTERGVTMLTPLLVVAVLVTLGIAVLTLSLSGLLLRALRKTGVSVVERIMGIVLAGLSVQFVYDGLVRLHVVALPR